VLDEVDKAVNSIQNADIAKHISCGLAAEALKRGSVLRRSPHGVILGSFSLLTKISVDVSQGALSSSSMITCVRSKCVVLTSYSIEN
ncbi:hypothetical protein KI387_034480, partial [Taxus chinensis]